MNGLKLTLVALGVALMSTTAMAQQTELRITHATTGGSDKDTLDKIVAGFEAANPDIKVKQIPFDDDTYSNTALITQLQGQDVPDIYFEWAGYPIARDAQAGYAWDLTDALKTDGWGDSFVPSVWSAGAGTSFEGKTYLVPASLDVTNTIWYNTDIFAENHLTPPKTWDAFIEVIKTLVASGETPIVEGNQEFWPFGNWASHIAAKVVPQDEYVAAFSRTGKFSTPGFEKALGYIQQLHDVGAFNKDMAGLGADPAMQTFLDGAAAMHPIGSWLIGTAADSADPDLHFAAFDTPVIDPTHPLKDSVIGTITGFVIHARSPHKEAAVRFLKYYTSFDSQMMRAEAGAALSPIKGVNEAAKLDEHTRAMAEMLAGAPALVPPPDTTYPVPVAEAYYEAAASVATGDKSPKDALAWLDDTIAVMAK